MRTKFLIFGIGLAVTLTAKAGPPVINSFDASGRLTFQETPGAVAYRVEWTTNLFATAWSSNAPGIETILPLGAGSLTVTVDVSRASCYYRVAASLTNTPPGELISTFNSDAENWLIVDYPFRSHASNPQTSSLPFDATFGTPAGSVRIGDVFGETGIAAPEHYLGNKLAFYGGQLKYDIYLRYTDGVVYPAIVLNAGNTSLYYDTPSPPVDAWQQNTIPLSETGWKVSGTGVAATEAVFKTALGNLAGLYIYTEWHTGADDTSVDNVMMTPP